MDLRTQFQKNFIRTLILCSISSLFSSCIQQQVWISPDYHKPGKRIWFAPIQGEGLAPGSAESLRAYCQTEWRSAGYEILLDSLAPAQRDAELHLHFLEFRYKRGLGEEPVAGLHAELRIPQKNTPLSTMQLSANGQSLNPWASPSLSQLSTTICHKLKDLVP